MKIYLASSWKNAQEIYELAETLRLTGHEVDAFVDASSGRYVFSWTEIPECHALDAVTFLADERSKRVFREDRKWLDWAECVVLVLPCGKSAHLEAGYGKGKGKRLIIYAPHRFPVGEFDVMYGFADYMTDRLGELINVLADYETEKVMVDDELTEGEEGR